MSHFKSRRSPYFFSGEHLEFDLLKDAFEAARWAPSPFNFQPWRFMLLKRDNPRFPEVLQTLAPRNQMWAQASSFLVVVCAQVRKRKGLHFDSESPYSRYDDMIEYSCGLSVGLFLAELTKTSLQAHQMRGFSIPDLQERLCLQSDLTPLVVVAIGKEIPFDPNIHGHFDEPLLLRSRVERVRKSIDQICDFQA